MAPRLPIVLSFLCLSLLANAQGKSFLTKPDVHGDRVVFTAEGDLWLGSLSNSQARRITTAEGTETSARFSPDGMMIAFTAGYEGGTDVYVMPTAGGSPKRLTYDPSGAGVMGWTPDGSSIIFRSRRQQGIQSYTRLWSVPVDGGQPKLLPVPRGAFASMGPDGLLAYVPVSFEWANWFRYQAGAADEVWLCDTNKASFTRLTSYRGVDTTPVWAGDQIYYVSESSGSLNLWRIDPRTKRTTQITKNADNPIRYPGSDGKTVVFQAGPTIAAYDVATGVVKTLSFSLDTDRIHTRDQRVPITPYIANVGVGPTGKRMLVETRGQVLSIATDEGDMRVLEKMPGTRAQLPAWAPDGKRVAFVSDRTGENEIWVTDATGGQAPQQLTKGLKANLLKLVWSPDSSKIATMDRDGKLFLIDAKSGEFKVLDQAPFVGSYDWGPADYTFSPDSKFLAYNRPEQNWIGAVDVIDLATGKRTQVSSEGISAISPAFSPDGKFLAYLEEREIRPVSGTFTRKYAFDNTMRVTILALTKDAASPFLPKNDEEGPATPAPEKKEEKPANPPTVAFDLSNLPGSAIQPPISAGRYSMLRWVPGKLLLLNPTSSSFDGASNDLQVFDIEKKTMATVTSGVDEFAVSADNKRLLIRQGSRLSVIDAPSGPATLKPVDFAAYTVTVQPEKEWQQIFEESWRIARDLFYDPSMHGVDWNAIKTKYQARMALVGDRTDLARLLSDMVSELNVGHAYIGNPDPYRSRGVPMGFLGIDVAPADKGVKVTRIYRGDPFSIGTRSPLLEPGVNVKEGDYIFTIAGQPVRPDQDMQALLVGLQNQTVAITVNDKPTSEGARTVRVKLLSDESDLRYQDWVQRRIDYVHKNGGVDFGYVHVPDMGSGGLVGFVKGQLPNTYKNAVVYDFRYNGGGFVSSLILDNIRMKPIQWFQPRAGEPWTRENWANIGYQAALCNEFNFSDGELVIEAWKRLQLGPVVGTVTGGGEVGSGGGYRLIDNGSIYVPNYAAYVAGKWIVEGTGTTPDYIVEEDPNAVMAGKDPQLDRAILLLKAQLAKKPIVLPRHPQYPNKAGS